MESVGYSFVGEVLHFVLLEGKISSQGFGSDCQSATGPVVLPVDPLESPCHGLSALEQNLILTQLKASSSSLDDSVLPVSFSSSVPENFTE